MLPGWFVQQSSRYETLFWEDGAVVYDEATGALLALGLSHSAVLQALDTHPGVSVEGICQLLFGEQTSADDMLLLSSALNELRSMNLVCSQ